MLGNVNRASGDKCVDYNNIKSIIKTNVSNVFFFFLRGH